MRRIAISAVLVAIAVGFVVISTGASNGSANGTYKIQLDNAFGLVTGAEFKVAGVPAGSIQAINLDQKSLHAVVTVSVTRAGFGHFHQSATCESRPQSLIGEYFIDCNPGTSGPQIKPGGTIPVSHTQSTIAADLVQNVMRLPYRQRFSLIVNELGAAAAARSGDLQSALHRAVPALDQTDRLLNLLANDSGTLQNLTRDSNSVITALANNSTQVQRFIVMANRTAVATSHQDANLRQTFAKLPGTLEQLRPAMVKLRQTAVANTPVLNNLNVAAGQLNRFFTDLPKFSTSAQPAIRSLGKASVTGKTAVTAARPTITDLNNFAKPTPELANNLSIVLHDLDTQSRAVERDPRSPGGKGFSGIQALLGYVFNQALAINTYGPYGHVLAVDAFFSKVCSPYQSPASLALSIQANGLSTARQCYSWLGPNQPGVNTTDPSDPSAKVPDPGGAPPGKSGPTTNAQRMTAADVTAAERTVNALRAATTTTTGAATTANVANTTPASTSSTQSTASGSGSSGPAINLHRTIGQIITGTGDSQAASAAAASSGSSSSSSTPGGSSAQALLNYLLAP